MGVVLQGDGGHPSRGRCGRRTLWVRMFGGGRGGDVCGVDWWRHMSLPSALQGKLDSRVLALLAGGCLRVCTVLCVPVLRARILFGSVCMREDCSATCVWLCSTWCSSAGSAPTSSGGWCMCPFLLGVCVCVHAVLHSCAARTHTLWVCLCACTADCSATFVWTCSTLRCSTCCAPSNSTEPIVLSILHHLASALVAYWCCFPSAACRSHRCCCELVCMV